MNQPTDDRHTAVKDAPTHEWETNEDGAIDVFAFSEGYHNGPRCKRCGSEFCHHCTPSCYSQRCHVTTVTPPAVCHASESARELCEQMSDDLPHIECPCGRAPGSSVTPSGATS